MENLTQVDDADILNSMFDIAAIKSHGAQLTTWDKGDLYWLENGLMKRVKYGGSNG